MNLLQEINLSDNQLTSFSSRGLSALEELDLSYNSLPSFSGSGLDSLTTLYLQTNRLTSFSGVGLRSIQYINMNDNLLPTFNGAGMGTLETIDLTMNKLTSFIPTGMTSLQNLYLDNNQLTSLPASIVNLSNLSWLNVSANLISSLPAEITTIDYLTDFYTQSNCLTGDSLSTSVSSWLNENASDDWTDRNPACPALPNTMYFCGELVLGGTSNWDTSINWKSDVSCKTPAPKNRPDASDNVIILTDVSENSGAPASVKTLEVRDDAIISRPITNGEG